MANEVYLNRYVVKHEEPYDPVKRREYYLRTRELKGRKQGSSDDTSGEVRTANTEDGEAKTSQGEQTLEQRRAASEDRRQEVKNRIIRLQAKLDELKDILSKVVAEAKLRAGVDPEDLKDPDKKTKDSTDKKETRKLTEAEKKERAKKAEEYREKEASKTSDQRIIALEARIAETKVKIQEAMERARQKIAESEGKNPETASEDDR